VEPDHAVEKGDIFSEKGAVLGMLAKPAEA
jgi:hypothetical protein